MLELFLYFLLGVFSGILAGLFGIGGGIIIIPVFFAIFKNLVGVPEVALAHTVLATSLGVIVFSSLASTYSHNKRKAVIWSVLKVIAPSICVGAALGAVTASYIASSTLQVLVAIFLVVISIQMVFEFPPPKQNPKTNIVGPVVVGSGIGWLSGIFGIGGGVFSVPYFYHRGLKMTQAIGSSAACGVPIAISGSISYMIVGSNISNLPEYSLGFVYLPGAIIVGLASAWSAIVGVRAAHRIKQKKLRLAFAILLMIMGLNLLLR
ncbi:MAG: sulfite exporter TauE/SafE family protein [Pseudomonadota bacterium]|nr:sulfite exporter TauE/SafE family protein [Pseudomonadota bacterium]